MGHTTLQLQPGVDTNLTEALNQAAVSECNLIRVWPDRSGLGLIQKLGGWIKYYANAFPSIVRALWAWQDTNGNKYLAIGCQTASGAGVGAPLELLRNGNLVDITPHVLEDDVTVAVTTTTSSNEVLITDTGSNITGYDMVSIPAHISVGGVILFGNYQAIQVSANTYFITLTDALGNPIFPTANVTTGGAVALFTTTNGSPIVTVTLNNHGYSVGSTYPVLITTAVGGITLVGQYPVQTVIDANNFTIFGPQSATSGTSASINAGKARYNYYLAFGPLPAGTGYGVGGYGTGGYGSGSTPGAVSGANITTADWTLDNFGEILIALPNSTTFGSPDNATVIGGPLYYWSPSAANVTAVPIAQGPIANAGFFVAMPQRQIMTWGTTFNGVQDPLMIRWCDVNNFFVWVGQFVNQAGFFRLPRGSRIVGGIQGPQQGYFLTDLALWSAQYIGQPDIYSFNEIGTGCGLIAKKAVTTMNGSLYWMGQSQFFQMAGEGVQPMPCDVWDKVFQNLDQNNLDKIRVAPNSNFNEVTWYYPSLTGGGEVDSYVKYQTQVAKWDYGSLSRTAWINQSVLGTPIGADNLGFVYQHEQGNDAAGQAMLPFFQTGYFTMSDGDMLTFLDQVWPDMKWGTEGSSMNATIMISFLVKNYPGDTPITYGPYSVTQAIEYISPRFRGRLVALKIASNDVGTFWRLGAIRYRNIPDGKF